MFKPGKKFTFILLSEFSQTIYSKLNEVIWSYGGLTTTMTVMQWTTLVFFIDFHLTEWI